MMWQLLSTAPNSMEAAVIKGLLESADIPVRLEGESLATLYGLTVGHLARVKIFVPGDRLNEAQHLLQSQLSAPPTDIDDAAAVNADSDPGEID